MTTPSTSFDLTASPDGCALAAASCSPTSPIENKSEFASDSEITGKNSMASSIYAADSEECKLELEKRALQESFNKRELDDALRRADLEEDIAKLKAEQMRMDARAAADRREHDLQLKALDDSIERGSQSSRGSGRSRPHHKVQRTDGAAAIPEDFAPVLPIKSEDIGNAASSAEPPVPPVASPPTSSSSSKSRRRKAAKQAHRLMKIGCADACCAPPQEIATASSDRLDYDADGELHARSNNDDTDHISPQDPSHGSVSGCPVFPGTSPAPATPERLMVSGSTVQSSQGSTITGDNPRGDWCQYRPVGEGERADRGAGIGLDTAAPPSGTDHGRGQRASPAHHGCDPQSNNSQGIDERVTPSPTEHMRGQGVRVLSLSHSEHPSQVQVSGTTLCRAPSHDPTHADVHANTHPTTFDPDGDIEPDLIQSESEPEKSRKVSHGSARVDPAAPNNMKELINRGFGFRSSVSTPPRPPPSSVRSNSQKRSGPGSGHATRRMSMEAGLKSRELTTQH